ncbi:MAG: imidazoleglycerol-phosphate dehydratase HisB [Planctomycetaceae bacterium]|jgi:imidazoleglycerol-phosphate dehydratase|nr:imidazoleglycerol-phosphate dehydratase HisB [Planctomycetaceae bacterium]
MRTAKIERNTKETQIILELNLDGSGCADISTGVGFFDHALTLLTAHSLIDLTVKATGDLYIDAHHTVEDVGISLGEAFFRALGDKSGIRRYGHFTLPMDETLIASAVDFSGRPFLVYHVLFKTPALGNFDLELVREFWQGFANTSRCNLHIVSHYGENGHHLAEAVFKATARAIRMAIELDPRQTSVPSTKGTL